MGPNLKGKKLRIIQPRKEGSILQQIQTMAKNVLCMLIFCNILGNNQQPNPLQHRQRSKHSQHSEQPYVWPHKLNNVVDILSQTSHN